MIIPEPELDEPWNWKVLMVECPKCHKAVPEEEAEDHGTRHWLLDGEMDEETDVPEQQSSGAGTTRREDPVG